MQQEKRTSDTARVRHAVTIIAVTILMEYAVNALIVLLLRLFPDAQSAWMGQILDIAVYLAIFLIPCCVMTKWSGWTLRDLNGEGQPDRSVYVMAVCLAAGWNLTATLLSAGMSELLSIAGYAEPSDSYVLPIGTVGMVLQIVQVAVIPPLVEELCFRGFFLKRAQRAMGVWPAILFTSVLFWLAHNSLTILPLAFGFGIIGGLLRVRYQSLLPSMCAHFVVNGTYIWVNWMQETQGAGIQSAISAAFILAEFVCLIIGVVMAARKGLIADMHIYMEESWLVCQRDWLRGIFTSIPFWIVLLAAGYFTYCGLEVLG